MKRFSLPLFFILCLAACSKKPKKKEAVVVNPFYDKAFDFREQGKYDSAFLYFNKAKDLFLQHEDSLSIGKCLVNMGIISTDKGDYYGGQELSFSALTYLKKEEEKHLTYLKSNFNNLGLATHRLGNYDRALKFYDSALELTKNPLDILVCENNKAKIYQELKDYDKALSIYQSGLDFARKIPIEYARTLTNIALTKWLQDPNYNPTSIFRQALVIREKENDLKGLNSSYAHLADYYSTKKSDSALYYAHKMDETARQINNPEDKIQALGTLVKWSAPVASRQYFELYQKLDDSVKLAENSSKKQFALVRYETEKSKAENLVLQKDNAEKKYQIIKREILLYSALFTLLAGTIISIIWYKKRKQKLELESQKTIQENQLKTSKKVHDVVANKIYSVISEIEHKKDLDKDHLLDKLDHIYQTSRDISYEITDNQQGKNFNQQLSDMLHTYVANPPYVKISGNSDEIWTTVSNNNKGEIFIVLQELMTNMKKHSKATEVSIQFHKKDNFISILYHDNGIGLPKNVVYNNGLTNTETRIKNISGTLTFDTTDNLGLEIRISFPAI